MKNTIKRIASIMLLIVVLVLTGCTNQDYTLVVNADDSSRLTVRYVVDKDTYDLLNTYGIDKGYNFTQNENSANSIQRCDVLFQEVATVFYDNGFEISPVNDAVEIGMEATKKYTTIDELNKDIPALYDKGIINFNGQVTIDENLLGKTYTFSGTVKYLEDPDASDITEAEKAELLQLYDTSKLNAEVFLRMPGDLVALDGTVEEGMAKYTASYDDGKEIPVHLRTKITNTVVRNIIFVVVFVVIVAGVVFGSRYLKKKKEQKKTKDLYGDEEDEY